MFGSSKLSLAHSVSNVRQSSGEVRMVLGSSKLSLVQVLFRDDFGAILVAK